MIIAALGLGFFLGVGSVFAAALLARAAEHARACRSDQGLVPLRWDGTRVEVDGSNVVSIYRAASVKARRQANRPKGQSPKDCA